MDTRWLRDFLAVAELGNFTRAAESLHSSQAALSRRIQQLEAWLGSTLIDRSVYPTRLTPEGERFRERAGEILRQVLDARGEVSGVPANDHVRVALPYALATANLPRWWAEWSSNRNLSCSVLLGNVHDMLTALVAGSVDLLICFHNAQQPIQLDPDRYERLVLGEENLRPYASQELSRSGDLLPGRRDRPVPVLMYSQGVYFGRLVEMILEAAPVKLHTRRVLESDMSDVLRDMAAAGYGVAWLPDCSVKAHSGPALRPIDDGSLSLKVSTVAFRNRSNDQPAVDRLWTGLKTLAARSGAGSADRIADSVPEGTPVAAQGSASREEDLAGSATSHVSTSSYPKRSADRKAGGTRSMG